MSEIPGRPLPRRTFARVVGFDLACPKLRHGRLRAVRRAAVVEGHPSVRYLALALAVPMLSARVRRRARHLAGPARWESSSRRPPSRGHHSVYDAPPAGSGGLRARARPIARLVRAGEF